MKLMLKLLVALIIVVIIAAGAILYFFDPNDYKPQIVELIEKQTGRKAVIGGDLGWSLFPSLSINASDFALSNPAGFSEPQMLVVGNAAFSAAVLPLMKGKLDIDAVSLVGARISLEQLADETNNWDSLFKGESKTDVQQAEERGELALKIESVEVTDSVVTYRDGVTGQTYKVTIRNLLTGTVVPGRPVPVSLDIALDSSEHGQFDLQGDGTVTADAERVSIPDLSLSIAPGKQPDKKLVLKTDLLLEHPRQHVMLKGLQLSGPHQASLSGNIDASGYLDLPRLDGELVIGNLPIAALMRDFGIALPFDPSSKALESLSGKLAFQTKDENLRLKKLDLKLDQTSISGSGGLVLGEEPAAEFRLEVDQINLDRYTPAASQGGKRATKQKMANQPARQGNLLQQLKVDGILTVGQLEVAGMRVNNLSVTTAKTSDTVNLQPVTFELAGAKAGGSVTLNRVFNNLQYSGAMTLSTFNPRKVLKAFGVTDLQFSAKDALTTAGGSFSFSGNGNNLQIDPLALSLDKSSINGTASVRNFSNPAYGFNLAIDNLDIDRYLPPATEATTSAKEQAASNAAMLKTLRGLKVNGKLKVGALRASGLKMQGFNGTIKAQGGKVGLTPLSAKLYKGSYDGNINLDATGKQLQWRANETFKGIALGPFLKDLVGQDRILGTANVTAKLRGSGITTQQMFNTLGGEANFVFRNGAVKGINLAEALREAKAKLTGKSSAKKGTKQTDFTVMKGSAKINKGVVTNNDLEAKSPFLRITGNGKLDLPKSHVNYQVTAKVVNTSKGQGGAEFKDLEGYSIPVRIKGPFDNLSYSLDVEALLKARAEQELEKEKDKLKEKAKEKLQEQLGIDKGAAGESAKDQLKGELLKGLGF